MSKTPILLVGAGGHARACIDVIEAEGQYTVAGLVGVRDEIGKRILGYPVLGADSELPVLLGKVRHALVTIGQIKTPEIRIRLFDAIKQSGCALPAIISPRAHVSKYAMIGEGTIVMHGAIVNAGATVGRNCIVNSQALVEHDCEIGEHCHIATAAAVNSGVCIGTGTFIGSNACVRQGTRIGKRCVIGMGQRVLVDCPDDTWLPPRINPA